MGRGGGVSAFLYLCTTDNSKIYISHPFHAFRPLRRNVQVSSSYVQFFFFLQENTFHMYIHNGLHYTTIEMYTSIFCIDNRNECVNLISRKWPRLRNKHAHTDLFLLSSRRKVVRTSPFCLINFPKTLSDPNGTVVGIHDSLMRYRAKRRK